MLTLSFQTGSFEILIFCSLLSSAVVCTSNKRPGDTVLANLVRELFDPVKYNKYVRPYFNTGTPSEISVGLYVQSLSSVNELNLAYTIDVYFRLYWMDPRLAFNASIDYLSLDSSWTSKIWIPDPYFVNSREEHFHTVTSPNILIRITPKGEISFSQRLSLTLSCNMDLKRFPMDVQTCGIHIMSYAFSQDDIKLVWTGVEMADNVQLPEYDLSKTAQLGHCSQRFISGTYSCLVANFTLTRRLSYYLAQTYIPNILIVVLSWVNFWLDPRATPARVSLGLLCVLTMTTQNSAVLSQLPRVSYIKAIDVWSSVCLVFAFGALLQFAMVNIQTRKKDVGNKVEEAMPECCERMGNILDNPDKSYRYCSKRILVTPERIDLVSRILFPVSFLIFNVVYWHLSMNGLY